LGASYGGLFSLYLAGIHNNASKLYCTWWGFQYPVCLELLKKFSSPIDFWGAIGKDNAPKPTPH
jgi:hypothetical protein